MKLKSFKPCVPAALMVVVALAGANGSFAQSGGALHGQVTDPSGAAVVGATIMVTASDGRASASTTNPDGLYEVKDLAPGKYKVQAFAKGFAIFEKQDVAIAAGSTEKLDIRLAIAEQQQRVVVSDQTPTIDVSPTNNAGAIVITGKDLDALSDDPDELEADLRALAGPSAGPNGGQIYIDGFTGGQLPPKSSIREIRINQNPFSPEYEKLGYGRIEIFTKPGTDQFHGEFQVTGNTSALNSRNPFASIEPGYDSTMFNGSIGGPLSKKASFFFSAQRRNINDVGVVNATVLDSNFNPVAFSDAVSNPRTRTNVGPRFDFQLTKNNTLTVRYQYFRDDRQNEGIGQFDLPSQGYHLLKNEQQLQASDTQLFGANIVNETRFRFRHETNNHIVQNLDPTISVPGAFNGGGNNQGNTQDRQNHYEFQNYTSILHGQHLIKFGARLRAVTDSSSSTAQFNGSFSFPSLQAFQITEQDLAQGIPPSQIPLADRPTLFTLTAGIPNTSISLFDAGLYAGDDWRIRPSITLSYGLRFETQTDIADHTDWAPRLAIAWGPSRGNKPPKTVLRAGWGIFYDRFQEGEILQAERLNGFIQRQFVVNSPDFFPNVPSASALTGPQVQPTIYRIAPNLRAPYAMQTAVAVERQLTKFANLSVTYLNTRGVHQLLTNNINAPLPGTFNPADPSSGVRPFGNVGNIFEYESVGIFKQNQMIINVNVRAAPRLSLFGYYTLGYAHGDTAGVNSFPSNPYNILQDYGRSAFDIRHQVFLGGSIALPYSFRLSPFLLASSGQPYNVIISQDLNGSTILNQRPAFASSLSNPANVVVTSVGAFDTVPVPGETIVPINFGTAPPHFALNLRLTKTFGFGKQSEGGRASGGGKHGGGGGGGRRGGPFGGGGGLGGLGSGTSHRYNLAFSINARNVFNYTNVAAPVGVVGSRLFGQSNALASGPFSSNGASRLLYLQATFNF